MLLGLSAVRWARVSDDDTPAEPLDTSIAHFQTLAALLGDQRGDRSDPHMTLGGHGIGRRKVYQGIGPQRWRCGIAAMLVLLSAFVSSGLHAASTDSVRLQIAGAIEIGRASCRERV